MKERTWLITLRKEEGLSQQQLADEVGISRNYLSEIENGVKAPGANTAAKIAQRLGFDMSIFFAPNSRVARLSEKHSAATA